MIILAQQLPSTEDINALADTLQGLDIVTALILLLVLLIIVLFGTLIIAALYIRSISKERSDESKIAHDNTKLIGKMQDNSNRALYAFARVTKIWEQEQKSRHNQESLHKEYSLRVETLVTQFSKRIMLQFDKLYERIELLEKEHHAADKIKTYPVNTVSRIKPSEKSDTMNG